MFVVAKGYTRFGNHMRLCPGSADAQVLLVLNGCKYQLFLDFRTGVKFDKVQLELQLVLSRFKVQRVRNSSQVKRKAAENAAQSQKELQLR